LRQPTRQTAPGAPRSNSESLPPPIGGLNARDSIANMKPEDAITLDNWFPRTTDVTVRRGYTSHATFTGDCESVLIYSGLSSTKVFVAVNTTNDLIIDATSGGAISTALVGGSGPTVQSLTSARFDYVQYGTIGGAFLSACNGVNTPLEYDGTTWSAASLTEAGLTSSNLFTNAVFAERMWFAEKNTFNVFYLPVRTKSGAMTKLNVGSLFKLADSTNTLTDYIGFVSTEGEVIAYAGTDPAVAATWEQVAHFQIGRPVCRGQRSWTKMGADALIVCADGVVSLRKAISTDRALNAASISDKVRDLIVADVAANGARFGWSATLHPTGSKLIVNVPTLENSTSRQYVMNTQTGAWTRYTGWNAFAWGLSRDTLYFGGAGVLRIADSGYDDAGSSIAADAKQAYHYFGKRGKTKQVTLLRPTLAIGGAAQIAVGVDTDYSTRDLTNYQTISGGSGDPWGGIWSATWEQAAAVYRRWFSVTGEGFAIAPRIKTITDGVSLTWNVTDVVYEDGGRL
jgi:hypothetical protein